jgi:hypothetical protein
MPTCLLLQIPASLPPSTRLTFFKAKAGVDDAIAVDIFKKMSDLIQVTTDVSQHVVFASPTGTCLKCERNLPKHNATVDVKFFGLDGMHRRQKVNIRCQDKECRTNYHVTTYGKKDAVIMYPTQVRVIEVTDKVIVDRRLFEQYCSFQ